LAYQVNSAGAAAVVTLMVLASGCGRARQVGHEARGGVEGEDAASVEGGGAAGADASDGAAGAGSDGAASVLARELRSADAAQAPAGDPFGRARVAPRAFCSGVAGKHVAERDLRTSFVSGDDLLALVNRSPQGQLAPDWAPSDLVDLRSGKSAAPSECDKVQCLRAEAAAALRELLGEMKRRGHAGKVESAYRGYGTQCGTFLRWAGKGSFCDATEQSALPGHSQHQLGTTVDLFTEEWAKDERGVFRAGFGCTPAGRFLQEHAVDFGFVMPYPIHPDDRHPKQSCVVRWDIPINSPRRSRRAAQGPRTRSRSSSGYAQRRASREAALATPSSPSATDAIAAPAALSLRRARARVTSEAVLSTSTSTGVLSPPAPRRRSRRHALPGRTSGRAMSSR
jgi:D-alanyl-D-alanine carboxypeptidase